MLPDLIAAYAVSSGLELQEGIFVASSAQVLTEVKPSMQRLSTMTDGKQKTAMSSPDSNTCSILVACVACSKESDDDA